MSRVLWYSCLIISWVNLALSGVILAEDKPPSVEELLFMKRFGYLPEDENGENSAYTAQSISEAVRRLQEFAGIPSSGALDDETKKLFHRRRCGLKDIFQTSRRKRQAFKKGWQKNVITFNVLNGSSTMTKSKIEELMRNALNVWAPYGRLQFVKEDKSKADIEILFTVGDHGDGSMFDGPGNIVAHAFGPPHGGMHFDNDEMWGESESEFDEEVTDFYAVAVHEAGHALGLTHSADRASIMYPYYQVPVLGLSEEDIANMYQLYLKPPTPSSMSRLDPTYGPPPKSTVATTAEDDKPDLCTGQYDIIAVIKNNIFVFKDKWLWIFHDQKYADSYYPILVRQFFRDVPTNFHIDAVYERRDGHIVLFSGQKYLLLNSNYQYIKTGSISDYFLPNGVNKVAAAFRSNFNNKTYLFQKENFYRFDEDHWSMDSGYPRTMQAWRNIPFGINSAVIWKGDTYLFKGPRFWRFDNGQIIAHQNYPVPTRQIWFGCPENLEMIQYLYYP